MTALEQTYFVDFETVPMWRTWNEVPEAFKTAYMKKMKTEFEKVHIEKDPHAEIWKKAGLYPEFARVICISVGFVTPARELRLVSFADPDEKVILRNFSDCITKGNARFLCAHNGKGFDYPFGAKRYIMNRMEVPGMLRIMGKKPWDLTWLIDTQELWSMGVFNSHVSLDLLAACAGIASPKLNATGGEINGSMVSDIWYEESKRTPAERLHDIAYYCEGDVAADAAVYLWMTGQAPLAKIIRSNASA